MLTQIMRMQSHWAGLVCGSLLALSCQSGISPERAYGPAVPKEAPVHAVEVHQPKTLGVLDTTLKDHVDTPVGVSCRTCHGSGSQGAMLAKDAPKDFHKGFKVTHGQQSCNTCHDQDRSRLHLADGKKLDFDEVVKLCAQCHGVQYRDYKKGSHGGMNGHWDLRRGGRERNNCVDCHSPHQPAIEKVWPVHPPKDRFLDWSQKESTPHE